MYEEFAEKATTKVTLLISLTDTDVHAHFSDQWAWGKSRDEGENFVLATRNGERFSSESRFPSIGYNSIRR